jgi:hypothetical protein
MNPVAQRPPLPTVRQAGTPGADLRHREIVVDHGAKFRWEPPREWPLVPTMWPGPLNGADFVDLLCGRCGN